MVQNLESPRLSERVDSSVYVHGPKFINNYLRGGPLKKVWWGGGFSSCVNTFSFTFPSFLRLNLAC